jgi:single-stranded DNA-binding protein
MNDITLCVVGNVVNEVELRFTKSGEPVASFRVAGGTRRYDRASERWVDGDTHYFTVSCWRGWLTTSSDPAQGDAGHRAGPPAQP